jgi:3-dehydroquinate synthase
MIGAFHQPSFVCCDLDHLRTLSQREYRCGLAEVVKHGVILDADLFAHCERHTEAINGREAEAVGRLVSESCKIKASVVEQDERETTGARAVLNYGHTFAHALETAADYETLQHGEAVAIGMVCAGMLAQRLHMVEAAFNQRQRALWQALSLPTLVPANLLRYDLVGIMRRDKKARAGKLRFILPTAIGKVRMVCDVDESLVREVLVEASQETVA